ncbi:MAG: hypothetical protein A3J65_02060 [Candidatus Buchananbacteria bacterium RIFCSPHIGHO2_02_FULL_45_11b]|uniref:Uncharacterized protein n=3 Tax=Candidatus Buchananiibacteriota TaxID=1817903 RepID=A0A1G1YK61_9BACT|nr:MAG: hypothetical protein A2663_02760 [Candidatus Buchananbacteria bacterium RIFCSPHIGHO2_01_FULL_46_12]OGY52742.1 MAG: hypothetical protein A3J65_02060 [Candidatus Buchananbacteria bacterium RIFCSPHIGHO2_02_FULL_45_11b]OGY52793.1 MAG: hypothetical protein A3B15_01450 [Candidatus Buchananbacteria bacterium RIFCSPLOWO2_01_FULL_45_31]
MKKLSINFQLKRALKSRLIIKRGNRNYLLPVNLAGIFPGDKKNGARDTQKKHDNQEVDDCRQAVFNQVVDIEISEK